MVECVVEFEYVSQEEDELSLRVGELLTDVTKMDGGWWEGTLQNSGKRGMFPDNFVKEIKKEKEKPKPPLSSGSSVKKAQGASSSGGAASGPGNVAELANKLGNMKLGGPGPPVKQASVATNDVKKQFAKVTFAYNPQQEDELKLEVGQMVEITCQEEEGWWEGTLHGKSGMFPSNFVELVEDSQPTEDKEPPKEANKDTNIPEGEVHEIKGRKIVGIGMGNIFQAGPIKLRQTGKDKEEKQPRKGAVPPTPAEPPVVPPKEPRDPKPTSDHMKEVGLGRKNKDVLFFNMTGDLMMAYDTEPCDATADAEGHISFSDLAYCDESLGSEEPTELQESSTVAQDSFVSVEDSKIIRTETSITNDRSTTEDLPLNMGGLSLAQTTPPPKKKSFLRKKKVRKTPHESPTRPLHQSTPANLEGSFVMNSSGDNLFSMGEKDMSNQSESHINDPGLRKFVTYTATKDPIPNNPKMGVQFAPETVEYPFFPPTAMGDFAYDNAPSTPVDSKHSSFTDKITDSVKLSKHRLSLPDYSKQERTVSMVLEPALNPLLVAHLSLEEVPIRSKGVKSCPGLVSTVEPSIQPIITAEESGETDNFLQEESEPQPSTSRAQPVHRRMSLSRRLSILNPKFLFRKFSLRRTSSRKIPTLAPEIPEKPESYIEFLKRTNRMSPVVNRVMKRYNIYSGGKTDEFYSWYFKSYLGQQDRFNAEDQQRKAPASKKQSLKSHHSINGSDMSSTSEGISSLEQRVSRRGSILRRFSLRKKSSTRIVPVSDNVINSLAEQSQEQAPKKPKRKSLVRLLSSRRVRSKPKVAKASPETSPQSGMRLHSDASIIQSFILDTPLKHPREAKEYDPAPSKVVHSLRLPSGTTEQDSTLLVEIPTDVTNDQDSVHEDSSELKVDEDMNNLSELTQSAEEVEVIESLVDDFTTEVLMLYDANQGVLQEENNNSSSTLSSVTEDQTSNVSIAGSDSFATSSDTRVVWVSEVRNHVGDSSTEVENTLDENGDEFELLQKDAEEYSRVADEISEVHLAYGGQLEILSTEAVQDEQTDQHETSANDADKEEDHGKDLTADVSLVEQALILGQDVYKQNSNSEQITSIEPQSKPELSVTSTAQETKETTVLIEIPANVKIPKKRSSSLRRLLSSRAKSSSKVPTRVSSPEVMETMPLDPSLPQEDIEEILTPGEMVYCSTEDDEPVKEDQETKLKHKKSILKRFKKTKGSAPHLTFEEKTVKKDHDALPNENVSSSHARRVSLVEQALIFGQDVYQSPQMPAAEHTLKKYSKPKRKKSSLRRLLSSKEKEHSDSNGVDEEGPQDKGENISEEKKPAHLNSDGNEETNGERSDRREEKEPSHSCDLEEKSSYAAMIDQIEENQDKEMNANRTEEQPSQIAHGQMSLVEEALILGESVYCSPRHSIEEVALKKRSRPKRKRSSLARLFSSSDRNRTTDGQESKDVPNPNLEGVLDKECSEADQINDVTNNTSIQDIQEDHVKPKRKRSSLSKIFRSRSRSKNEKAETHPSDDDQKSPAQAVQPAAEDETVEQAETSQHKRPKRRKSNLMRLLSLRNKQKRSSRENKSRDVTFPFQQSELSPDRSGSGHQDDQHSDRYFYDMDIPAKNDSAQKPSPQCPDEKSDSEVSLGSYTGGLPKDTPVNEFNKMFDKIINHMDSKGYISLTQPSYSEASSARTSVTQNAVPVGSSGGEYQQILSNIGMPQEYSEVSGTESQQYSDFVLPRTEYPAEGVPTPPPEEEDADDSDQEPRELSPHELFITENSNFRNFFQQDPFDQLQEESAAIGMKYLSPSKDSQTDEYQESDDTYLSQSNVSYNNSNLSQHLYDYPWHSHREQSFLDDSATTETYNEPNSLFDDSGHYQNYSYQTDVFPTETRVHRIYKTQSQDVAPSPENDERWAVQRDPVQVEYQPPQDPMDMRLEDVSYDSPLVYHHKDPEQPTQQYDEHFGALQERAAMAGESFDVTGDESLHLQEISFNLLDDMSRLLPGLDSQSNSIWTPSRGEMTGYDETGRYLTEDPLHQHSHTRLHDLRSVDEDSRPTEGVSNDSSPDIRHLLSSADQNAQDYYTLTTGELSPGMSPRAEAPSPRPPNSPRSETQV